MAGTQGALTGGVVLVLGGGRGGGLCGVPWRGILKFPREVRAKGQCEGWRWQSGPEGRGV